MDLERDLARLDEQERVLRFRTFDLAAAWELGTRLRDAAVQRGVAIAIEVRLSGETVFFCAMPGTTPENADWARRKRSTVELIQRSSYAVGRKLERDGATLEQKMGLPLRDYAAHGGAFPIRVEAVGCVGVVTISGLPQREDHALVTSAIAEMCGVSAISLPLD
jgi:uncharacterized protein (UPF0303 family)